MRDPKPKLLLLVTRGDQALLAHLRRSFADVLSIEVIEDRRHGDRRHADITVRNDRREGDRRRRNFDDDLRSLGRAVVRLDQESGPARRQLRGIRA